MILNKLGMFCILKFLSATVGEGAKYCFNYSCFYRKNIIPEESKRN